MTQLFSTVDEATQFLSVDDSLRIAILKDKGFPAKTLLSAIAMAEQMVNAG